MFRSLLPLVVFVPLALVAFHVLFLTTLFQSGLDVKFASVCTPDADVPHPARIAYTHIPDVDFNLCGIVAFFHTLMNPANSALLAVLFPFVALIALIPFLEDARDHRPFVLRLPGLAVLLFQFGSMGSFMPIYTLLFVVTGTALPSITKNPTSNVNQTSAETLFFGLVLGYVLPTILMISLLDPYMTAIWQVFPLCLSFCIFVYKTIRSSSPHARSGHSTVVATLAFVILVSALLYAAYVWPILTDGDTLRSMFVPLGALDPATITLQIGSVEFIKWDMIFATVAFMSATLWMADSLFMLVGIIAWHGIATIALGPTAAIASVFLWRETRLNKYILHATTPRKLE